jgi:hypothetical protein
LYHSCHEFGLVKIVENKTKHLFQTRCLKHAFKE